MTAFSLRSTLFILTLLTVLSPIQEANAQWGGLINSGMSSMRRGGNSNSQNSNSNAGSQNNHANTPSPGANLLTYEQMEAGLSQLETSLKLTQDQTKAWDNFASKVRIYASDVAKERARLNSGTAPQGDALKHLNTAEENAKSRYTSLKEVEETAKPLYKLLSNEQKGIFDSKISSFIAASPQKLPNQSSYNLPDMGGNPPADNGKWAPN